MTKPNEFYPRKTININALMNSGFLRKDGGIYGGTYTLRTILYRYTGTRIPAIYLIVTIMPSEDNSVMTESVVNDDWSIYSPFYNEIEQHDNEVYETVVNNYNKIMKKLVDKHILKTKRSKEG